jgi:hypothetical protein
LKENMEIIHPLQKKWKKLCPQYPLKYNHNQFSREGIIKFENFNSIPEFV